MFKHRIPKGSVFRPILFLIFYINNLSHAIIKYCTRNHFVGDTNLLHLNSSIKKLNRLVILIDETSIYLAKCQQNISIIQKTEYEQKGKALEHEIKIKYVGRDSILRVRLNRSWFVIHDKVLNYHDIILCYHKPFHNKIKKIKINGIINGSVTFKLYESCLNMLNTELC